MTRIARATFFYFVVAVLASVGQFAAQTRQPDPVASVEDARSNPVKATVPPISSLRIVEMLSRTSEGATATKFESTNSRVTIETDAINTIVSIGLPVCESVLTAMSCDDISFDVFVKCYTCLNQIFHTEDASLPGIAWGGGAKFNTDTHRVMPGFAGDTRAFRDEVITDATRLHRLLLERRKQR